MNLSTSLTVFFQWLASFRKQAILPPPEWLSLCEWKAIDTQEPLPLTSKQKLIAQKLSKVWGEQ